jgi:hypothetical protein
VKIYKLHVVFSLSIVLLIQVATAQQPIPSRSSSLINSPRPLADAVQILQATYGKVVTYEESMLTWQGDLEVQGRDPKAKWALIPRTHAFTMPAVSGSDTDLTRVLENTIAAYHQQTSGIRFKVLSSTLGYHVVPVQGHDENGRSVSATSVLDHIVTVPSEARTAEGHLQALTAAISSTASLPVHINAFPGGGHPDAIDRLFRPRAEVFPWGVSSAVARDALVDLFTQSATTFSWKLKCQASAQARDRFCVLNVGVIEVAETDSQGKPVTDSRGKPVTRGLAYDRCRDCSPEERPLKR